MFILSSLLAASNSVNRRRSLELASSRKSSTGAKTAYAQPPAGYAHLQEAPQNRVEAGSVDTDDLSSVAVPALIDIQDEPSW